MREERDLARLRLSNFNVNRNGNFLDALAYLHELRCPSLRVSFQFSALRPGIGLIVMIDEAKQQAGYRLVYDQTNIAAYPHGPEILIFGFVEAVKTQSRTGRIQLEVKRGGLDCFLLVSGQSRQTVGEGICDAEFHHPTLNTFIASSPRWLMTLTAIRPDFGLGNGREVSLLSVAHASKS